MADPFTVRSLTRHQTYYIPSADLSFLLGHVQFRVHRYFFERESAFFRGKLTLPMSPGASRQGSSDSDPLVLEDVKAEDFERFLWVFYNPRYSLYDAQVDDWSVILHLAHIWGFGEVKSLAVRELEKKTFSHIDRIVVYQANDVDRDLLIPHFAAICARESPLTLAEGIKLGMETTLVIASAREYVRANPTIDGLRSPVTPTVQGDELYDMIRELFNIPAGRKVESASKDEVKPSYFSGGLSQKKANFKKATTPPLPTPAPPSPPPPPLEVQTRFPSPPPPPPQQNEPPVPELPLRRATPTPEIPPLQTTPLTPSTVPSKTETQPTATPLTVICPPPPTEEPSMDTPETPSTPTAATLTPAQKRAQRKEKLRLLKLKKEKEEMEASSKEDLSPPQTQEEGEKNSLDGQPNEAGLEVNGEEEKEKVEGVGEVQVQDVAKVEVVAEVEEKTEDVKEKVEEPEVEEPKAEEVAKVDEVARLEDVVKSEDVAKVEDVASVEDVPAKVEEVEEGARDGAEVKDETEITNEQVVKEEVTAGAVSEEPVKGEGAGELVEDGVKAEADTEELVEGGQEVELRGEPKIDEVERFSEGNENEHALAVENPKVDENEQTEAEVEVEKAEVGEGSSEIKDENSTALRPVLDTNETPVATEVKTDVEEKEEKVPEADIEGAKLEEKEDEEGKKKKKKPKKKKESEATTDKDPEDTTLREPPVDAAGTVDVSGEPASIDQSQSETKVNPVDLVSQAPEDATPELTKRQKKKKNKKPKVGDEEAKVKAAEEEKQEEDKRAKEAEDELLKTKLEEVRQKELLDAKIEEERLTGNGSMKDNEMSLVDLSETPVAPPLPPKTNEAPTSPIIPDRPQRPSVNSRLSNRVASPKAWPASPVATGDKSAPPSPSVKKNDGGLFSSLWK